MSHKSDRVTRSKGAPTVTLALPERARRAPTPTTPEVTSTFTPPQQDSAQGAISNNYSTTIPATTSKHITHPQPTTSILPERLPDHPPTPPRLITTASIMTEATIGARLSQELGQKQVEIDAQLSQKQRDINQALDEKIDRCDKSMRDREIIQAEREANSIRRNDQTETLQLRFTTELAAIRLSSMTKHSTWKLEPFAEPSLTYPTAAFFREYERHTKTTQGTSPEALSMSLRQHLTGRASRILRNLSEEQQTDYVAAKAAICVAFEEDERALRIHAQAPFNPAIHNLTTFLEDYYTTAKANNMTEEQAIIGVGSCLPDNLKSVLIIHGPKTWLQATILMKTANIGRTDANTVASMVALQYQSVLPHIEETMRAHMKDHAKLYDKEFAKHQSTHQDLERTKKEFAMQIGELRQNQQTDRDEDHSLNAMAGGYRANSRPQNSSTRPQQSQAAAPPTQNYPQQGNNSHGYVSQDRYYSQPSYSSDGRNNQERYNNQGGNSSYKGFSPDPRQRYKKWLYHEYHRQVGTVNPPQYDSRIDYDIHLPHAPEDRRQNTQQQGERRKVTLGTPQQGNNNNAIQSGNNPNNPFNPFNNATTQQGN